MTTEARPAESTSPAREERRRSKALRWILEGILLVGAFFAISSWQERHLIDRGDTAPDFDLQSLAGERVSLASLRGKNVLLHFWAPWCGVCKREFGTLSSLSHNLGPDEALVSIVTDAPALEDLRRFAIEHDIDYPVLIASDDVVRAFHVSAYPTNYYLDGDGYVRDHSVGMTTRYAVQARLGCVKR